MSITTYTKRLEESAPYAYDFKNDALILAGDTLSTVVSVVSTPISPSPPSNVVNLVVGAPSISGTQVVVSLSGGQDESQYLIEFIVTTTNGYTRVGEGYLCVSDR